MDLGIKETQGDKAWYLKGSEGHESIVPLVFLSALRGELHGLKTDTLHVSRQQNMNLFFFNLVSHPDLEFWGNVSEHCYQPGLCPWIWIAGGFSCQ